MEIEIQLDPQSIVVAQVEEEKDSFSHEFGVDVVSKLVIKNWEIHVLIDNLNYEAKRLLNENMIRYYEERILKKAEDILSGI